MTLGRRGDKYLYIQTGDWFNSGKAGVCVSVGRWTVNPLAERDKEAEADKSDREEEGQLAADGHGRDVEGEFDMTIGDRETAEQTHAWANMVGNDKDVLMPQQPAQIKWAARVQDWASAAEHH